jgi:hypothetical protein
VAYSVPELAQPRLLPRNARMLRLAAHAPGGMETSRDEDGVHVTILFGDSVAHAAAV